MDDVGGCDGNGGDVVVGSEGEGGPSTRDKNASNRSRRRSSGDGGVVAVPVWARAAVGTSAPVGSGFGSVMTRSVERVVTGMEFQK